MRGHELLESHSLKSARRKILRTLLIKSLNGNVLISRDDKIARSCIARESNQQNYVVLISRDDEIARSCIARESVIATGAQQKPAHVI